MAAIVGGGLKAAGVEIPALPVRRRVLLGGLGVVLLLLAFGPLADNGPDNDDDPDPDDGDEQRVAVAVPATQKWTDTSVDLEAGDVLAITAEGQIRDDVAGNPERFFPPEGAPDPAGDHHGDPFQGFNHAALVGRIGDAGDVFKVGAERTCSVTTRGRLFLAINDGRFDDNDGQYDVTVVVRPRAGRSSAAPCTGDGRTILRSGAPREPTTPPRRNRRRPAQPDVVRYFTFCSLRCPAGNPEPTPYRPSTGADVRGKIIVGRTPAYSPPEPPVYDRRHAQGGATSARAPKA